MPFCTSCGADNGTGRFCVKCGTPLPLAAESWRASSEIEPAVRKQTRPIALRPMFHQPSTPIVTSGSMTPSHHHQFGNVAFKCPYCQSQSPPLQKQKISTAGWILFVVLLLACFPLCWIGLLMKEDFRSCSFCGLNLG